MTINEANRIGQKQGINLAFIGLICSFIIVVVGFYPYGTFFNDLFSKYLINVLLAIFWLFLFSILFGKLAAQLILIQNWNYILVGVLSGLAILVCTAFFSSLTGYIQATLFDSDDAPAAFNDYVMKPMIWIVSGGFFPALFGGIWMAYKINKSRINIAKIE